MVRERVGGEYWGHHPPLPQATYTLVAIRDPERHHHALTDESLFRAPADCDPWHLLSRAAKVVTDGDNPIALLAALLDLPVTCVSKGMFDRCVPGPDGAAARRAAFRAAAVDGLSYRNPFDGQLATLAEIIALCAFWREMIDSNRGLVAAMGFAGWKRKTVRPLLWPGLADLPFTRSAADLAPGSNVAVWRSRLSPREKGELASAGAKLVEVEDGFIRSVGLGADCVPPLSITVDRLGAHFDPAAPSELELLIQHGKIPEEMVDRARRLRGVIVASGISKYGSASTGGWQPRSDKHQILVPGQVEDDRSVISGGGAVSTNLELLKRVRQDRPDAHIIYKPHPDVIAGHRIGAIPEDQCRAYADEILSDAPISTVIAAVDEVHVNTSLAGFEALLRHKPVTTHGVPFYAGWGLTRDLGAVPERRLARPSLDALVAAVLLIYPRYLDPDTGLPCPPEVLIQRLSTPQPKPRPLVALRRLQGRLRNLLAGLKRRAPA
ncbi:beta-3-deoxy-D-manno-oct-2-ulosonic acid transferase [Sphingomonas sp. LY160]|uniref:capsular polysaccharide export protein, LipB/KpsS family n=1 Tax=Sphingomonas sp. LY160 TaxID=3095342 RepID=UPI002ADEDAE3|nr:beta-3-deoxy-D-manno-oct-2-ulosonic acid transferase [Sphingomonas sp. LY160]MEA1072014.1 beta-3-deoxy-D-manno-oct-2-ulosonic acid transferase [Sphingomonas sp. LY160]